MSQTGYSAETVTVGSISDKILQKPVGSGVQQITPTIPAAIAQTAHNTLPSPAGPYYTRSSSTVLVLTMPSTPGFGNSSLMGVFWEGADGSQNFCPDCTIGVSGDVVTVTAPTLNAEQLAAGALYFNGADTTGAGDVSGKKITAGTTEVTYSVATVATADLPSNPDLLDYTIPVGNLLQLLITCNTTGCTELIISGTGVVLALNYSTTGDFYSWLTGQTPPWTGTVNTIRFYNSTTTAQTMSVGALMQ